MKRALFALGFVFVACATNQDSVCENVGACSHGGSSDWIKACQDEAKLLKREADANGCGGAYDDYYSCADDAFTCDGATSTFPGCDAKRDALSACITNTTGTTACTKLANATLACNPDAGSVLPPACTVQRDCEAQCRLDHVANACAPTLDELSAVVTCAASCPP